MTNLALSYIIEELCKKYMGETDTVKKRSNSPFTKQAQASTRSYFMVLALLVFLGCAFYLVVQNTLLKNAQEQGMRLARIYAKDAQDSLASLDTLLTIAADTLDQNSTDGWSEAQQEEWIHTHLNSLQSILERDDVIPYAILNGKPISSHPLIAATGKELAKAPWYQQITDTTSAITTEIYYDPAYEQSTLTIAHLCQTTDAAVAFDIFPVSFLSRSSFHLPVEEAILRDRDYSDLPDQWIPVTALPRSGLFQRLDRVVYATVISLALFLAAFVWISLRDRRLNAQMARINETVQVLGNSYYAIYRINFNRNTYEIIKGSDYISSILPPTGGYNLFLNSFRGIIEDNAYQDFIKTFSTENLRALVSRHTQDFGGDFQRRFGDSYRWVNVRILFDEVLRDDEAVLCFREIEAEKKQQLQEKQLLETALENSRRSEKNQLAFFNSMSHDMRTPLNAIVGLTRLIEQYKNHPEKLQTYISQIQSASRQLLELINDILDMSRLEQGQLAISNQKFHLTEAIRQCTDNFQAISQAEGKPFHIQFSIQNNVVTGDPFRMTQILNNLLSNAFKYTEPGDQVSLSVRQFRDGMASQYMITVSDTGIGMSEEFLEQLFEPYCREVRFFSRQVSGTGLGLAIVKNLVNQMDGQINVKSELGQGTTFTLVIPFLAVNEDSEEEILSNRTAISKNRDSHFLDNKKILLVEDNEINMEISTELLLSSGIQVTQAWNGKEALEIFKTSAPGCFDAILMDMQMPIMDGCQAAKAIRALARPDAASIPIIAVTANAFAEDIAATEKAGMNAHVAKPIDFSALQDILEELINNLQTA